MADFSVTTHATLVTGCQEMKAAIETFNGKDNKKLHIREMYLSSRDNEWHHSKNGMTLDGPDLGTLLQTLTDNRAAIEQHMGISFTDFGFPPLAPVTPVKANGKSKARRKATPVTEPAVPTVAA